MEVIDHIFMQCRSVNGDLDMIVEQCPTSTKADLYFIDWIEYFWKHESVYNKLYHRPLENFFVIIWAI